MRPEGVEFLTADGVPVEREIETIDWDAEAAEKGGYETFMLKEIHEQADAVAETIADRTVRPDGVDLPELDDELLRDCRADHHRRLRHLLPRGPDRPLRDRGVGARAGRDGHRVRVPLPQPGRRPRRPRDRHHAVGRDRRHAGRDAARPRARRDGDRGHEHHGLAGHARRRRRAVHARRAWRSASPRPRRSSPRSPAMYLLALRIAELRGTLERRAPTRAGRRSSSASRTTSPSCSTHGSDDDRPRRRAPQRRRSSSSTSAATSACRCASRAR